MGDTRCRDQSDCSWFQKLTPVALCVAVTGLPARCSIGVLHEGPHDNLRIWVCRARYRGQCFQLRWLPNTRQFGQVRILLAVDKPPQARGSVTLPGQGGWSSSHGAQPQRVQACCMPIFQCNLTSTCDAKLAVRHPNKLLQSRDSSIIRLLKRNVFLLWL